MNDAQTLINAINTGKQLITGWLEAFNAAEALLNNAVNPQLAALDAAIADKAVLQSEKDALTSSLATVTTEKETALAQKATLQSQLDALTPPVDNTPLI